MNVDIVVQIFLSDKNVMLVAPFLKQDPHYVRSLMTKYIHANIKRIKPKLFSEPRRLITLLNRDFIQTMLPSRSSQSLPLRPQISDRETATRSQSFTSMTPSIVPSIASARPVNKIPNVHMSQMTVTSHPQVTGHLQCDLPIPELCGTRLVINEEESPLTVKSEQCNVKMFSAQWATPLNSQDDDDDYNHDGHLDSDSGIGSDGGRITKSVSFASPIRASIKCLDANNSLNVKDTECVQQLRQVPPSTPITRPLYLTWQGGDGPCSLPTYIEKGTIITIADMAISTTNENISQQNCMFYFCEGDSPMHILTVPHGKWEMSKLCKWLSEQMTSASMVYRYNVHLDPTSHLVTIEQLPCVGRARVPFSLLFESLHNCIASCLGFDKRNYYGEYSYVASRMWNMLIPTIVYIWIPQLYNDGPIARTRDRTADTSSVHLMPYQDTQQCDILVDGNLRAEETITNLDIQFKDSLGKPLPIDNLSLTLLCKAVQAPMVRSTPRGLHESSSSSVITLPALEI